MKNCSKWFVQRNRRIDDRNAERRKVISTVFRLLIAVNLLLAVASPVHGMMEGLSTEKLTRGSELVVLGDVESTTTYRSQDGRTILTGAVVVVNEVIKGQLVEKTVLVEYPGGELDGIGLKVSDEPVIRKGEKVVLFLNRGDKADKGAFHLVGKAQGKYHVGADGVARKMGFSIAGDPGDVDANIPLDALIGKIRRAE